MPKTAAKPARATRRPREPTEGPGLWRAFKRIYAEELDEWLVAERLHADAMRGGDAPLARAASERLVIAESHLHRVMVDFAMARAGLRNGRQVVAALLKEVNLLMAMEKA